MIDLNSNLAAIEKLFKLMDDYRIDEVSIDFVCIKKSKFQPQEATAEQIIDKHTNPNTLQTIKASTIEHINTMENWLNGNK